MQTRFALILYFHMVVHKLACHTLSNVFLNQRRHGTDSADVFTQTSYVEDLFYGAPFVSESSLFFSNYLYGLGLFNMTFKMNQLERLIRLIDL